MSNRQHAGADVQAVVVQLRTAAQELRSRGLKQAAKFASDLLLGVPLAIRRQMMASGSQQHGQGNNISEDNDEDLDRYTAALTAFDMNEYARAHHMLEESSHRGSKTRFLQHYALYMAGEKSKEELELTAGASHAETTAERALPSRDGVNPHLKELYNALRSEHDQQLLDGFGLFLYAVVLKRLGYATTSGNAALSAIAPAATSNLPHPARAHTLTTRSILFESIQLYPWNWSAWMELAELSSFISLEEEELLRSYCPWMLNLFQAHILIEQQQNEAACQLLEQSAVLFPRSTYLLAQKALTSYHMRDFDQAQEQFERLSRVDPHRVETMDVYSNVLYVKEDKIELSRLAHRALQVEKYCPETCCIIGNYYSLKNKHDRAILYFHRALKLDPNFLSAWTLIGHEYIEMKNTNAAIDAYRHAVDVSDRDYRAWYGLGQAYEILNMYLYSIYYYRKAASIRPYDARMWCALGGCYEKLNKSEDAVACFRRALGNHDREGIASYHLGRIFAQRNDQHEAAKYYMLHLGLQQPSAVIDAQEFGSVDTVHKPSNTSQLKSAANVRIDTPQALASILFLANYYKQLGNYVESTLLCNRLLDLQGPEKEEAKALLREMRSLEAVSSSKLLSSSLS